MKLFHPEKIIYHFKNTKIFVDALIKSNDKFIVVYPNNDMGSEIIIDQFNKIKNNPNFKIFRSLRFEYFLSLLYNSKYMIGNSSAGIKEAPYYKIPSINIGTRQNKRSKSNSIINTICNKNKIIDCIKNINLFKNKKKLLKSNYFGSGNSDKLFIKILKKKEIWNTSKQKQFQDL